jgi:hypothetical protein
LIVTKTFSQIEVVSRASWSVGMNLIGPLKETSRGNRYILRKLNYFTEWVEAVPIQAKDTVTVAKAPHEHIYIVETKHPIKY